MVDLLVDNQLLTIMLVLALGAALGQVPFGPLRFGAAGALFVGLAIGALGQGVGEGLQDIRDLGLALFVYTVGLAAGTTFFRDFRRQWPLMACGSVVLLLIGGLAVLIGRAMGLSMAMIAGAYSGTLTSTPALAAAAAATGSPDAPVGYSLSYPVGVVVAIIGASLLVTRKWPGRRDSPSLAGAGIIAVTTRVDQPMEITAVPGWTGQAIRMSYLTRAGRTRVIHPEETLHAGDLVLIVGPPDSVQLAIDAVGHRSAAELTSDRTDVDFERFVVSNPRVTGRTVAELGVPERLEGIITRVRRGDLDMVAGEDLVLQPGDLVLAVVPRERLEEARAFFGDSHRRISEIDALSAGIGMALGLLVGLISIPLPGGAHFSLGMAAGPLLVGMVLGGLHRTGPIVWDLPQAANLTIRQLGLLVFLATIGLASGASFVSAAFSLTGLKVGAMAAVLMVAALAVFTLAGHRLGLSAPRTAGAMAGLVGQPAILSYATGRVNDERIESGYAALFALSIIVKILVVQVMAAL